jgi:hypothetical protein
MGVSNLLYEKYLSIKENYFSEDMEFLEIGDQDIIFGENKGRKMRHLEGSYYSKWESIDLHKREGVTIKDLSIEHKDEYKWDIISNFGTSEHVEPQKGHYNCWKNIHAWTKIGGYAIHEIPEIGSWKDHCRFYYDFDFFKNFEKIGYRIIDLCHIEYEGNGNLVFCLMEKMEKKPFFSCIEFDNMVKINEDTTSSVIASENNPKGLIF